MSESIYAADRKRAAELARLAARAEKAKLALQEAYSDVELTTLAEGNQLADRKVRKQVAEQIYWEACTEYQRAALAEGE